VRRKNGNFQDTLTELPERERKYIGFFLAVKGGEKRKLKTKNETLFLAFTKS
jgi:hypothetical protein